MMKTVKYILSIIFVAFLMNACNNGIDDITQVNPGADETAPSISIVYPTEGTEIKVFEDVTSIEIEIKVTDDIEIKDIKVQMDGNQIALFDSFTDYRIAIEKFTFDNLTDGDHKLTVVATDLEGKTTTKEVNFKK
ncbi:MAG: hypothetical protein KDC85_10235, partial [Saprospiraceae bacterium]|nr:hypothetical protein [Saprospiraceae bacterium]